MLLLLLCYHYSYDNVNDNDLEFIFSGHLNPGESALEAALRETQEEAGLDKADIEYYHKFEEKITYATNGKSKDVSYYLARIRNYGRSIKLPPGHQNVSWLKLHDACQLLKHKETGIILRKAEAFIQFNEQDEPKNHYSQQ